MCDPLPSLHALQHRKQFPLLRRSLHCGIQKLTIGMCENNWTPRLHGELPQIRAVLNGKKKRKSVPVPVFPKKPAGTPCAQPWLVAVGGWWLATVDGWQLATGGWWRLVVVGGGWWFGDWWLVAVGSGWQLAVGRRWRLAAVGGGWWLAVGGSWRLAVGGSWRLAVGGPLGRSLRAVLSKKKKNLVP